MKSRIPSFLLVLFIQLLGWQPACAQLEELNLKKVFINDPASEIQTDTQWYLLYNMGRNALVKSMGPGNTMMMYKMDQVADDMLATEVAGFLFRFVKTDDDGVFIQSGLGDYLGNLTNGNNNGSTELPEYKYYYHHMTDAGGTTLETSWYFRVGNDTNGLILDGNGANASLAGWGTTPPTSTSSNACYAVFPVTLNQLSEEDYMVLMLWALLEKYNQYQGDVDLNVGTDFGQYADEQAARTFKQGLDLALSIGLGEVPLPTAQEMRDLYDSIEENYKKYIQSEVLFSLKSGYYRIIANLVYYNEQPTGEKDAEGNDITVRQYVRKALLGTMEGEAWWDTQDSTDCRQLWNLQKNADGTIRMVNAGTEMQIDKMGQPVTMSAEAETPMMFDFVGRENDHDIIYIRAAEGTHRWQGGVYLHQWGHYQGAGTCHTLCAWDGTFYMGSEYSSDKGTSEWYLEEVTDEEAKALIEAYEPVRNHDLLEMRYQELIAQAKEKVAETKTEAQEPLITNTSQFSSMWSEKSEGSFANLLDFNNHNSFWHSAWSGGKVPPHLHCFEVSLAQATEGNVRIFISRRGDGNGGNDHLTLFSLYGSNEASAIQEESEDGWELIQDYIETPWERGQLQVFSQPVFIPQPYKYLRFYCDGTTTDNGFFHMAGFQIYLVNGMAQWDNIGQPALDLEAILQQAETADLSKITIEDYNRLKDAYDAFAALVVNPQELSQVIAAYAGTTNGFVQGSEPGYWSSDTQAKALDNLIDEARTYYKKGNYTREQCDKYISGIKQAAQDYLGAANSVGTDKWYTISFPQATLYEGHPDWDINNTVNNADNMGSLFGQYATVATRVTDDGETAYIQPGNLEDMRENLSLYFTRPENINEPSVAQFRFVSVGDSAYALQNRASGLYIRCTDRNNYEVYLSLTPTLFRIAPLGYGTVLLCGTSFEGRDCTNLHAQNWDHRLVTWEANTAGTNSALMLQTVEDVQDDYLPAFNKYVHIGKLYPMCYPERLKAEDGQMYAPQGSYTDNGKNYLAFNKIEQSQPGVPFVFLYGDRKDFDAEAQDDDREPVLFHPGQEFMDQPGRLNGMVGTYQYTWVDPGVTVFVGNHAEGAEGEENTDCTRDVYENRAYVHFGETFVSADATYDLVVEVDGELEDPDAISTTPIVSTGNSVYNLQGVRLDATRRLPRGIYIISGTKVFVK